MKGSHKHEKEKLFPALVDIAGCLYFQLWKTSKNRYLVQISSLLDATNWKETI